MSINNKGKILVRFSKDQLIADDIQFPPTLRNMIIQLAEDNMESLSATVVRICTLHFNRGKTKYPVKIREKVLEYAIKHCLNNRSHAIKKICQEYFEKNPVRQKPILTGK